MSLVFQTLTYIFGDMLNSVMAAGKVFEYLDRKPQVSTDGKLKPDQLKGHIRYHSLNFAYPSNPNKTVLQVREILPFIFSVRSKRLLNAIYRYKLTQSIILINI